MQTRPLIERVMDLEVATVGINERLDLLTDRHKELEKRVTRVKKQAKYVRKRPPSLSTVKCWCGKECSGEVGLASHQRQSGHTEEPKKKETDERHN